MQLASGHWRWCGSQSVWQVATVLFRCVFAVKLMLTGATSIVFALQGHECTMAAVCMHGLHAWWSCMMCIFTVILCMHGSLFTAVCSWWSSLSEGECQACIVWRLFAGAHTRPSLTFSHRLASIQLQQNSVDFADALHMHAMYEVAMWGSDSALALNLRSWMTAPDDCLPSMHPMN